MESTPILIVDDDPFMQEIMSDCLSGHYQVVIAESAEACEAKLAEQSFGVILLDIELPGRNGYEICSALKAQEHTADTPVIFVSGQERLEDRLRGYEVGGADYVIKPFQAEELRAKVDHLLTLQQNQSKLRDMANYASQAAFSAMTTMGEMGSLIATLKEFHGCTDLTGLAEAVLRGIGQYGLEGTVQVRAQDEQVTLSSQGQSTPLELSVIEHLATMGRIMQYRSRLSLAFDNVALVIKNLPVDDPDRCGRLRDHLAILCEAAEISAKGQAKTRTVRRVVEQIGHTLAHIDRKQRERMVSIGLAVVALDESLSRALLSVALTDAQEDFLLGVVKKGVDNIPVSEDGNIEIQNQLSGITQELQALF